MNNLGDPKPTPLSCLLVPPHRVFHTQMQWESVLGRNVGASVYLNWPSSQHLLSCFQLAGCPHSHPALPASVLDSSRANPPCCLAPQARGWVLVAALCSKVTGPEQDASSLGPRQKNRMGGTGSERSSISDSVWKQKAGCSAPPAEAPS